jgi:hypothetical protein
MTEINHLFVKIDTLPVTYFFDVDCDSKNVYLCEFSN